MSEVGYTILKILIILYVGAAACGLLLLLGGGEDYVPPKRKKWDDPLDEYEDWLINNGVGKDMVGTNGGIPHADRLMKVLIKSSKGIICMYCPSSEHLIKLQERRLEDFLIKGGRLYILLNDNSLTADFQDVVDKLLEHNNVEIEIVSKSAQSFIESKWGGDMEFMTFDMTALRLVFDKVEQRSVYNFGDPEGNENLRKYFYVAWVSSKTNRNISMIDQNAYTDFYKDP